jgi:hypothetical protein
MIGRSRKSRSRAVVLTILVLSVVAFALPVFANLTGSTFDAGDGNLVVNGSESDWASAPNLQKGIDKPTGQTDDSFGQGTKEDTAVPTIVSGQIPPQKSDLTRFYVANEKVSGDDFLYLAWERVQEPNGTTNMDFEFNQVATPSANTVTPIRTAGDVLIKYDLSQGGTHPTLGYHLWKTTGVASQVCEASNSLPCWGKVQPLTGFFEGAINDPSNNPTDGSVVDPIQPGAPRTLSSRTFGEGAINLTDSGILPAGTCKTFGAAYLKSRSSDSFTAAVKDFIAPIPVSITNCGTVKIHKTDDSNPAVPLKDAVFTLYTDNVPVDGAAPHGAEDVATSLTCTTDAAGDCTISNVPFGSYWAVETTGVSGYDLAADQSFTLSSSTTDLTISLTFVDNRQKGAIQVIKNAKNKNCSDATPPDGCSDGKAPLAGAGFEIWQESNGTADLQTSGATPDTKIANQQLTVLSGSGASTVASTCFGGLTFGTYYVHESAAPSGYAAAADKTATISTASTCATTTVSKTFTDTPLTDVAVSATSQVPGATESTIACVDANGDDVGNSGNATTDPASADANDLEPGTYTCTVVIDP